MATAAAGLSPYHTLYSDVNWVSSNQVANTSQVSELVRLVESSNYGAWSSTGYPWNSSIDGGHGDSGSAAYDFRGAPDTVVLLSTSKTIAHAADGTKVNMPFTAYYGDTAFPSGIGSGTASNVVTLPAIPRGAMDRYDGAAWPMQLVERWDGTQWKLQVLERWNGTAWVREI
jgi:hypothetical protein